MSAFKQVAKEMSSPRRQKRPKREVNSFPLPLLLPRPLKVGNPHHEYVFLPPKQRVTRPAIQNIEPQPPFLINAKQTLLDDFNQRKDTVSAFPQKLTASTTRAAVKQF